MIYTKQSCKAMELCYRAHAGQVDKSGMPYVFHPIHLAEQMDDEVSTVVALLHDVVEDTNITFGELEEMGFQPEVLEALRLLTHDKAVAYEDYVQALSVNPVARKVKMADLQHNMDVTRRFDDPNVSKLNPKYVAAMRMLRAMEPKQVDYSIPGGVIDDITAAELKKMDTQKYQDQIRGSLIAGAAGDALGYEVEFDFAEDIFERFGRDGITEYVTHKGLARISDDTQMTMYTAIGLLVGDTRLRLRGIMGPMESYIHVAYLDWLHTQYEKRGKKPRISWLNNLDEVYAARAPGNTCLSALRSGTMGSVADPINQSKGCGGVMRVAPIGLFFKNQCRNGETDRILDIMHLGGEAAAITHGHPLGYIPAAALVHIVNRIVYGGCKYGGPVRGNWPSNILRECKELLVELYGNNAHTKRMNDLIDLAANLASNDKSDVDNIHAIGGGWVGDEALAIAIYCWLRYPTDLDRALIASVNHSGDADSTGAILGNILGAAIGYQAMGRKWKKNLELHDVLLELADDLCVGCRMNEYGSYEDPVWEKKYVRFDYTPADSKV